MTNEKENTFIPSAAVIIDAISNIVGAYVIGASKRTQYYSFIDTAKGNSLQQPYLSWFAKSVLEPLERTEKSEIAACLINVEGDRRYRGFIIDDEDKVARAESRFSRCKGWFEETHKETAIFRAYFVLDRVLQKYEISLEKQTTIPDIQRIVNREYDKLYQTYDERLLETSNGVEDRLQNTLATILSKPIYGAYYAFDAAIYHILGISAHYPDLVPRQGFSLMIVPAIRQVLTIGQKDTPPVEVIKTQQLVGIGPLSERQAAKFSTWLTANSFSKLKDVIGSNGKNILNNAVAISLGTLLSATIVTNFYTPPPPALEPAFIEAIKAAKFDFFTFKNGDLGIVTYEMPNIPERMRFGDVCRVAWKDVDMSFARNSIENFLDLVDRSCPDGFLSAPVEAYYDEHGKALTTKIEDAQVAKAALTEPNEAVEDQKPISDLSTKPML